MEATEQYKDPDSCLLLHLLNSKIAVSSEYLFLHTLNDTTLLPDCQQGSHLFKSDPDHAELLMLHTLQIHRMVHFCFSEFMNAC